MYSMSAYNRSRIKYLCVCGWLCARGRNKYACQTHPRFPASSALHDMKHLCSLTPASPWNLFNLCKDGPLSLDVTHLNTHTHTLPYLLNFHTTATCRRNSEHVHLSTYWLFITFFPSTSSKWGNVSKVRLVWVCLGAVAVAVDGSRARPWKGCWCPICL